MTDNEKSRKYAELFNDEEKMAMLEKAESKEEVGKKLAEFGFEVTDEELDAFIEFMINCSEKMEGNKELSEEDLQDVAGGEVVSAWGILTTAASLISKGAKTCYNLGKKFKKWEDSIGKKK